MVAGGGSCWQVVADGVRCGCWNRFGLNCAGVCLVSLFSFLFSVFNCVYLLVVVSICCQERLGG